MENSHSHEDGQREHENEHERGLKSCSDEDGRSKVYVEEDHSDVEEDEDVEYFPTEEPEEYDELKEDMLKSKRP